MTERTIYVVMGTTGEFSDRTEWPVAAFRSEEAAQERVRLAEEWLQQHWNPSQFDPNKGYYGQRKQILKDNTNPYDPDMDIDYTGTTWFIYTVQLAD